MEYLIDKESLYALVDEEVSHVADEAYTEDGTALYDSIVLTEKDKGTVERLMDDAAAQLVVRAHDICRLEPETEGNPPQRTGRSILLFYVPDFDMRNEQAAKEEISRYMSLYVCTAIFQKRRTSVVEEYSARALAALNSAIGLLKQRKHPLASW